MEVKHSGNYDFKRSLERIDEILNSDNKNFEERDKIPSRNNLTFNNGYYVNVSAIFVDMRDSSSLTNSHKRSTLAKIYRAFTSEVVAILNGSKNCVEINIVGDCVSGIFETHYQEDINELIDISARINSIIKILNYKLEKKEFPKIKVGIGIDYGRSLMIKSGFKGNEINDVVWMGDVVNNASKLSDKANNGNIYPVFISESIYTNLYKYIKNHFKRYNNNYCGNIVDTTMEKWYKNMI